MTSRGFSSYIPLAEVRCSSSADAARDGESHAADQVAESTTVPPEVYKVLQLAHTSLLDVLS